MDNMRIPEDQITPILPFRNPRNTAEVGLNKLALKMYNDPDARENDANTSAWSLHPEKRGYVYFASVGWTSEGWRTFVTLMDLPGILGFADTTVQFMDRAFAVNIAASKVEAGMPIGQAAMEMLAEAKSESEDCGNPDCVVHGVNSNGLEAIAKLLTQVFGM